MSKLIVAEIISIMAVVFMSINVQVGEPNETIMDESMAVASSQEEVLIEKELDSKGLHYFILVDGVKAEMPIELQDHLYNELSIYHLEELFPICIAQAFQESSFNVNAVSKDGLDIGLYQFRKTYWQWYATIVDLPSERIENPYHQIEVYVRNLYRRLVVFGDLDQAISKHYAGEDGFSQEYLDRVYQWLPYLIQEE